MYRVTCPQVPAMLRDRGSRVDAQGVLTDSGAFYLSAHQGNRKPLHGVVRM